MAVHLMRDLERLKKELLVVGGLVEEATEKAILTVVDRRSELAPEVIRGDREIDGHEVELEEECLKVLALHQPVANDLRFVLSVIKVNNDLERMGDLAKNIAQRGRDLGRMPPVAVPDEIKRMARSAQRMVKGSLNAMVEVDLELARWVIEEDDEVDALHKEVFTVIKERIRADPEVIDPQIQLLSVSRYLERIADLATNIAEDVVFLVEGEVIRHQQGVKQ